MSASLQIAVEKAIAELAKRNVFKKGSAEFEVRTLFPVQSWQPHTEPCRQAGSVVIGEDSCGNLFLHAPDAGAFGKAFAPMGGQGAGARSVVELVEALVRAGLAAAWRRSAQPERGHRLTKRS